MGVGARKNKKTTSVEYIDKQDELQDQENNEPQHNDYGISRQYDPTFRGPIRNRSCTDVICCILFVVFLAGIGVVAGFAFVYGNPDTLIYPSDYKGRICGVTEAVKNKRFVFYFDWLACLSSSVVVTLSCPTPQVCVERCPNVSFSFLHASLNFVNWDDFICLDEVNPREFVGDGPDRYSNLLTLFQEEKCASYYIKSAPFVSRCIPFAITDDEGKAPNNETVGKNTIDNLEELVNFMYNIEIVQKLMDDFLNIWPFILAALVAAAIFCFFLLIIMQWITSIVVWAVILLFFGLVAFGDYFCYSQYFQYNDRSKCGDFGDINFNYLDLDCYLQSPKIWLAFSILLSVIGVVLLLLVLLLFNRIRIAIALVEEASRALGMMVTTLFAPVVPFLLQIIFAIFWGFVMVFLATSNEAVYKVFDAPQESNIRNGTVCDKSTFDAQALSPAQCQFTSYETPWYRLYFQIYMVFGLFWMVNFIIAFGELSVAGAFASYYWAFSKPADIPSIPILSSMWRALRYHLGSLAFGSLIVTIVQIIRVMLEYAEKRIKGCGLGNAIAKFILCCCKCLFWCLEKFIRFINRNAYIEIAIYGRSFCLAAKDAFFLLMRNILRASVLNSITSFLLFIYKLTVTLGVTVGAFYFFTWQTNPLLVDTKPLNYIWAPIAAIAVFAYVISAVMFGVYDMGVDTLFLCFLEDLERNDGSPEKPYYMPKNLMSILDKKNRKVKKPRKGKQQHNIEMQGRA